MAKALRPILKKLRSAFTEAEYEDVQEWADDWFEHARLKEGKTIDDLEKHLWLGNAAALTLSGGLFSLGRPAPPQKLVDGLELFVLGLAILVILKYLSVLISSRDRYRMQDAFLRFERELVTDEVFSNIRDAKFKLLRFVYLVLQYGAGLTFLIGCSCTVYGLSRGA